MNIWRRARLSLQNSLFINFKYQHKLTKYISKFNKFIKFKTFLIIEMNLFNILIKSRIFTDKNLLKLFIFNNLIYLNGYLVNNLYRQIFVGDFIQFIINLKYYIIFKWILNISIKKKKKFRIIIKNKNRRILNPEEKKKSSTLPKWITFYQNMIDDVSKYLEVDYFTLSIFIIYEPFLWSDLNIYNIINNKFSIINIYNWKYIT
jgi:hypothetical protein